MRVFHYRSWPVVGCLIVVLSGVACSENESSDSFTASPITLSGTVTHGTSQMPMSGVSVCADAADTCVSTDDSGRYSIEGAPSQSAILMRVVKDGFVPLVLPVDTPGVDHDLNVVSLLPESLQAAQSGIIGVEPVIDRGGIVFSVSNGVNGDGVNVPGISVSLQPPSGEGPFYVQGALPSRDLSETSQNGGGLWVNIMPGDYALSHVGLREECRTLYGYGGPRVLRFPVLADAVTVLRIECPDEH